MTVIPQVRADVERNRATILGAAIILLGQHPQSSMQQVADAAGLNRATLYRHFRNRDDLLAALQAKALADSAALAETIPTDGPALPALLEYLEAAITVGERYRFISMAPRTEPSLFGAEGRALRPVAAAVRRGQAQGEFDPHLDPGFVAGLVVMLVIEVVGVVERGSLSFEDARAQAMRTFGNVLRARRG
ncbi:TetR/AcrR family transcriptional regulator [Gordonia soli]|uniref:TetR/AcrR family transcriptional regulator n=1 Tax=Gordonia soli TaxID=320799 RepID=UPI001FDF479A|nr:TetR/AcrR family transcriptional regulator [Gordonia soli]